MTTNLLMAGCLVLKLWMVPTAGAANGEGATTASKLSQSGLTGMTNLDLVLNLTPAGTKTVQWLPGSLGEHISSNILVRLRGKSAVQAMDMFASKREEATHIVRNPGFWLNDLPNITAYSAIRAYGISAGKVPYGVNATLVTRRHFIQAKHNMVAIGSPVVYVAKDNRRIVRSVIDWYPSPKCNTNFFNGTNDCLIVQQLNEAVPEEILPLQLLPDDANRYFGEMPPSIAGRQSKRFGVSENASTPFVEQSFYGVFRPLGGPLVDWYLPPGGGDSGSTTEYIIHGHLVLAFPSASPIIEAVKVLNSRHRTTELPTTIDLSSFPPVR